MNPNHQKSGLNQFHDGGGSTDGMGKDTPVSPGIAPVPEERTTLQDQAPFELSRRGLVASLFALIGGFAAATSKQAGADTGDDLVLGRENTADTTTRLVAATGPGSPALFVANGDGKKVYRGIDCNVQSADLVPPGFAIQARINGSGNGVIGIADGSGIGVSGEAQSGTGIHGKSSKGNGVYGEGGTSKPGVRGLGGSGVQPDENGGTGVHGEGGDAAIHVLPGEKTRAGIGVTGIGGALSTADSKVIASEAGVLGINHRFSVPAAAETQGVGVVGFGHDGVKGIGSEGRGGIFKCNKVVAQVQLVPVSIPVGGGLPDAGEAGDLLAVKRLKLGLQEAELYFCVQGHQSNKVPAKWKKVQLV